MPPWGWNDDVSDEFAIKHVCGKAKPRGKGVKWGGNKRRGDFSVLFGRVFIFCCEHLEIHDINIAVRLPFFVFFASMWGKIQTFLFKNLKSLARRETIGGRECCRPRRGA